MKVFKKIYRLLFIIVINFFWHFKAELATKLYAHLLRKGGATISHTVNYISAKVWFDGSDYSRISIGHGVTISSNVRLLTHDWSPNTIIKFLSPNFISTSPLGIHNSILVDDYSFIGTGCIIMPGAKIGKGCIIGAGAVVRGTIPDGSIVIGNPSVVIGSVADYIAKKFSDLEI